MKQEDKYYINEMHAYHCGISRPIFEKWEMIKRFFRFLKDPAYLVIEIRKTNNYKIKNSQWFDKDGNLIDDVSGVLEKNGTIDENGNLITETYGLLTKTL